MGKPSVKPGIPWNSHALGAAQREGLPRTLRRRYEYVKKYELDDMLLPGCFIVVRVDGKGFTKWVHSGHTW